MTNHPNRNCKYAYLCPQGFANDYVVWRVKQADVADVQALIDSYADNPSAAAYWLTGSDSRKANAVDWEDRRYTSYAGSAWGY